MIRAATDADAGAICAIWNPVIRDTTITFTSEERRPEDVAAMLSTISADGHGALVAELAGEVAGFAFYRQFRGGPGYARSFEHTVHVAPAGRGRGLGRALVAGLVEHARAAGGKVMVGGVSGENPAGLAFHEALGFRPSGILPGVGWKFGRAIDLHFVTLPL